MRWITKYFVDLRSEQASSRAARGVLLHDRNQVRVGGGLELVFRDFLNTVDQAEVAPVGWTVFPSS
ncbi:hypothetical protein [Nitrospira sp. BLG_2]|uniref:hypothetical protein n=1 Tax=Nitrospira sp. BLG_2 TaxID=3397507 RepID=UPI003B98E68B